MQLKHIKFIENENEILHKVLASLSKAYKACAERENSKKKRNRLQLINHIKIKILHLM